MSSDFVYSAILKLTLIELNLQRKQARVVVMTVGEDYDIETIEEENDCKRVMG